MSPDARRVLHYLRALCALSVLVLLTQGLLIWQQRATQAAVQTLIESQEAEMPKLNLNIKCGEEIVAVLEVTQGEIDPTETQAAFLARAKATAEAATAELCDDDSASG